MVETESAPMSSEEELLESEIDLITDNIARIQLTKHLRDGNVRFPIDPDEIEELGSVTIAERVLDTKTDLKQTFAVSPNSTFIINPYGHLELEDPLLAYAEVKDDTFHNLLIRREAERESSGYNEIQKHTEEHIELNRRFDEEIQAYLDENRITLMQSLKADLQTALTSLGK